jgi:hypothetical protein
LALTRFDPPGFLDDLNDQQRQQWSDFLTEQLDGVRNRDGSDLGLTNDGPRLQFFNRYAILLMRTPSRRILHGQHSHALLKSTASTTFSAGGRRTAAATFRMSIANGALPVILRRTRSRG